MRQGNLIIEDLLSAGGLHHVVGKGGGEVCLDHILSSLAVEGLPWEEFRPLLTGSLPANPGFSGLRVSGLVVDGPAQAGGQQVLPVGEGSQHVEVPHPVHVQGGQEGQVRVRPTTAVFYQGDPALLIPSTLVFIFIRYITMICTPVVSYLTPLSPLNIIISLFTFSELASQHFRVNTEDSHQNI